MIAQVETQIETTLKTITVVASSVYTDKAPYNVIDPYIEVSYPTGQNDYDSMKTYPQGVVQVAGYSRTKTTVQALEASVLSKLDRQTLTMTNYKMFNILLQFQTQDELEGVYFFIHQYQYDIEPT